MVNTFTQKQLLRLLYGECDTTTKQLLNEEIQQNYQLKEEHETLKMAKYILPKVWFNASPLTLRNILRYSKMAVT